MAAKLVYKYLHNTGRENVLRDEAPRATERLTVASTASTAAKSEADDMPIRSREAVDVNLATEPGKPDVGGPQTSPLPVMAYRDVIAEIVDPIMPPAGWLDRHVSCRVTPYT
eukprot:TRINITY_DN198_c1_g1_i1.p1 TRINITY_DN198_c1_g1~~TRINITY_DN198_c1_g1_i1.p1  ORF type:complete len:112 (-),score=4.98 TRINITY_DN198_c1_g1_i1:588-923(-)